MHLQVSNQTFLVHRTLAEHCSSHIRNSIFFMKYKNIVAQSCDLYSYLYVSNKPGIHGYKKRISICVDNKDARRKAPKCWVHF
uniref:Uncharacterized protein n=1 Tax=Pararge aegeria TaxID=116150 RepID=S4NNH5_9NEOP